MRKVLAAIFLLAATAAAAQTTPEGFKAAYERQKAAVGLTGLGVKGILESWNAAFPNDTLMLEAVFAYNLAKGRSTVAVTRPEKKYLGRDPLLTLKDSTGRLVHYFEVPVYDEEYFASAQKALDKAITLAPNNIGYLFDEITSLLDYEGDSPDMAATALLNLIDRNYSEHPDWNLYGAPFSQQDFTDAVKEYCYSFWKLATPVGYDSFYNVSSRMMRAEPNDPGFIDNVGAYWQVAKKDNKKAAKFYKKALKLDPNDYAASQNMKFITNHNKK